MACMACHDEMVMTTAVYLRDAEVRVIQGDDDVSLEFGSSRHFELSIEPSMVDKILPVLTQAQEHFRRVAEQTDDEERALQDA